MVDISSSDKVDTKENLTNHKPWFNGVKSFSSVKVQPPQADESLPPLGIHVSDTVDWKDRLG